MEKAGYGRLPVRLEIPNPSRLVADEPLTPTSSLTPSSRMPSDASVNTIVVRERTRHDRRKERLNTELLVAVSQADLEQTIRLLDMGASPEATCVPGRVSASHIAAYMGHKEILANLLMRGATGEQRDKCGRQPVHLAAWAGRNDILDVLHSWNEALLESPIRLDVNTSNCEMEISDSWSHDHDQFTYMVQDEMVEGSTPLHLACKRVNLQCVNLLMSKGVNINIKDSHGLTPLDVVAVDREEEPLEEPTEEQEADDIVPDTPLSTFSYDSIAFTDKFGGFIKPFTSMTKKKTEKPRQESSKKCDNAQDIVKTLIQRGAALPKTQVVRTENSTKNQTQKEVTTLHTAVVSENSELIGYLLGKNACMRTWNREGETPIHLAVKRRLEKPLKQMLDWETERPVVGEKDIEGRTPLHVAVLVNWTCGVSLLLEAGADIKDLTKNKETVLHLVATQGYTTMLEEFLSIPDARKILDSRDMDLYTPLHRATEYRRADCVELLVRFGADTTLPVCDDYTLLHIATEGNSLDIVQFLLSDPETAEKLKNVRSKDKQGGETPLHIASREGYTDCVNALLYAGCDILAKTTPAKNLSTPLHLAAEKGYDMVVEMILNKNCKETLKIEDGSGWTPLHVAAFSGSGPCVKQMLLYGADIAATISDESGKKTGLDVITYSVPQPVQFLEDIFDSYIKPNEYPVTHSKCEIEIKYSILIPEGTSNKQMNVLNAILNSGRYRLQETLLLHPIVETFLYLKWTKLRNFFFFLMALHILLTLSLTSLSLLHYVVKDHDTQFVKIATLISRFVLVASFLPILITEILNLSQLQKYYWKDYETWVKWCVFLGTWAVGMTNHGVWWARYLASITVLLAWIELLFFMARCPTWGYYVLMFSRVAVNVFKVLGTFMFLILGFTFSFMIHFEATQPFGSIWESFVKVLIMMIELDYAGTLPEAEATPLPGQMTVSDEDQIDKNNAAFFILGRGIFIVFLILVAIVLTNLMVGLAVSDIHLLETQGRTQRLAKQVGFLSLLEFFVYNDLLLKCMPRRVREGIEKRRCVAPRVLIEPASPRMGNFFFRLPSNLRESVLEKVASKQLREDCINIGRLDQKIDDIVANLGQRRNSYGQETIRRTTEKTLDKFDQALANIVKELKELRTEVQTLRPRTNGRPTNVFVEDLTEESGPLLV